MPSQHIMRKTPEFVQGLKDLINTLPKDALMVELGSFAGQSSLLFSQKVKRVYCVDLWGDSCVWGVRTGEKPSDIELRFDEAIKGKNNIVKLKGRTDTEYSKFEDQELDFVYIDAAHDYANVRADIINWLPKIKYGGIIGGHDYSVADFPGVVRAVTEIFGDRVRTFSDTSWVCQVKEEKISVLMPVYNREKYIEEAIKSILSQTHSNFELLIYDDGSTDSSVALIKSLSLEDRRISLVVGEKNRGIVYSRNKLLELCSSRIAVWQDSDDLSNINRLETQHKEAQDGRSLVFCHPEFFSDSNVEKTTPWEDFLHLSPPKRVLSSSIDVGESPRKFLKTDWGCKVRDKVCGDFICGRCTPTNMFPVDKSILFTHKNIVSEDCMWIKEMTKKYHPILLSDVLYYQREHADRVVNMFAKISAYPSIKIEGRAYSDILDEYKKRESIASTISVLMPVYNREKFVGEAIESILNQSYKDLRLLIYDDGSTDSTVKIIKSYAEKDNRIELFEGKENLGSVYSRNFLLDKVETVFAAWMDSDDLCDPTRLEKQFDVVRGGGKIVFTEALYFNDGEKSKINPKEHSHWICKKSNKCVGFMCNNSTPCSMFPVDKNIKFKTTKLIGMDCLWVQDMIRKYSPILLEEVLYFHRRHLNRLTMLAPEIERSFSDTQIQSFGGYGKSLSKLQEMKEAISRKYLVPEYSQEELFVSNGALMSTKRLVVTIVSGNFHRFLGSLTHSSIKQYAKRCGADFKILTHPDLSQETCLWKKFTIRKLFEEYSRVLYIDTDIFVSDKAENLFNMVPEDCIGAYNEAPNCKDWIRHTFKAYLDIIGLPSEVYMDETQFINAGLFLVSKQHEGIFYFPDEPHAYEHDWDVCGEQAYININIKRHHYKVHDIGVAYNAFICRAQSGKIYGVPIEDCRMYHFAGEFKQEDIRTIKAYEKATQLVGQVKEGFKNWARTPEEPKRSVKMFPSLNERISVLMPVYNRDRFVGQAIESILRQTYKNFELIICDDGSTDNTFLILERYAKGDKRIRLIRNEKNKGIPISRNLLLTACDSDFACWQDSDDISNIHRLEIQKKHVRGDLIVKANCKSFPGNGSVNWMEPAQFHPVRVNCLPSVMFPVRKDILCQEKFVLCGEDDAWIADMSKECKIVHIPDILYYYRVWDGRITDLAAKIRSVFSDEEISGKTYEELLEMYKKKCG